MKIVLVEDDPRVLKSLSSLIRKYNRFQLVAVVSNAEDALYSVGKWQPDMVIADIKLPGLSGIELMKALQSVSSKSKVLIYSGCKDKELVKLAIKAGAAGYIVKGGSGQELIHAISDVEQGLRPLSSSLQNNSKDSAI